MHSSAYAPRRNGASPSNRLELVGCRDELTDERRKEGRSYRKRKKVGGHQVGQHHHEGVNADADLGAPREKNEGQRGLGSHVPRPYAGQDEEHGKPYENLHRA